MNAPVEMAAIDNIACRRWIFFGVICSSSLWSSRKYYPNQGLDEFLFVSPESDRTVLQGDVEQF
jgi:hypothetical protein